MNRNQPFFIVGTERSGSNLLRAILNSHTELSIPHPPHIMKELGPRMNLKRYQNLDEDKNFYRLIDDVIKLVQLHFVPWPVALDRETLFLEIKERNLYAINAYIYQLYLNQSGKNRWGCKSTFMIHYIDQILRLHPKAQFIHLVRDGRDVAVSARRSVFNHYHPYYVAKLWSKEQALALSWKEKLTPTQFITVRYEDLITRPEVTIRSICSFLTIDYDPELLQYYKQSESKELSLLSSSWENISSTFLSNNFKKYKRELSADNIKLFESIALHELHAFSYPLENKLEDLKEKRNQLTVSKRLSYFFLEKWSTLKIEFKALINDKNFKQRWKKKLYVRSLHD